MPAALPQIAFTAALAWAAIADAAPARKTPPGYARGMKHLRAEQFDRAIVYLSQTVAAQPRHAKALDALCRCYIRTGDYEQAAKTILECAKLDRSSRWRMQCEAEALRKIVEAKRCLARGDRRAAKDLLEAATGQRTHHPDVEHEAAILLGHLHFQTKDYAAAAEAYAPVADAGYRGFGPDELHEHLAALIETGHRMEAVKGFDTHKALIPEATAERFHELIARAYHEMVDDMLAKAPPGKGQLLMAREMLVKGLERIGTEGPAKDRTKAKLLAVKADLFKTLMAEGDAAVARKDTRAACIAYDDAMRLCQGIDYLTWIQAKRKFYPLLCAAEKRFLEGWELFRQKRWQEAIAAFDDVLRRYPRGKPAQQALFNKAGAYRNMGRKDTASQYYQELVATYPDAPYIPWACFEVAEYHSSATKPNHREGLKWLRYAVDNMPNGHNTDLCQYYIATTYWEMLGNYKQAYVELKKFLDLYPESDLRERVELRIEYIERKKLQNVVSRKPRRKRP